MQQGLLRGLARRALNQLRDVDFHRATYVGAHRAEPIPIRIQDLLIHSQGRHAQELARVHPFDTCGRAAGRAGAAGQTEVEISTVWQQLLHLVDEHAFLFTADFDRFFSHSN
jgi:hypothetical protein